MDTAIVLFTRDLRLRFDRDGKYVRRYVPELVGLDAARIQTPWRQPARERPGYPDPIVEPS